MLEKLNFLKQTTSTCIRLTAQSSLFVGRRNLFLTAKIINNDDKSKSFLEKSNFISYICKQNQNIQNCCRQQKRQPTKTNKYGFQL